MDAEQEAMLLESKEFRDARELFLELRGRTSAELLRLLSERYPLTEQDRQRVRDVVAAHGVFPSAEGDVGYPDTTFEDTKISRDRSWSKLVDIVNRLREGGACR